MTEMLEQSHFGKAELTTTGETAKPSHLSQLVLSVFHGIDMLGRGFEKAGYCVVRAAELDLGFDVRDLHLVPNKFDGIIAGTPCNDFSLANRKTRSYTGYGKTMLDNFTRLVTEAEPLWWLLENVPTVPSIAIPHYSHQRFDLNALECNSDQSRLRHFQFGSRSGHILSIDRSRLRTNWQPCVTASEGSRGGATRRNLADVAELQGLPRSFTLPYFKMTELYKVIGQGVNIDMGEAIARAITNAIELPSDDGTFSLVNHNLCKCGCGRQTTARQKTATVACRKRLQRYGPQNHAVRTESEQL